MFTGTMIEDLIRTVEKTENRAQNEPEAAGIATPRVEAYPAFSMYVYQWQGIERGIVGVA